MARSSRVDDDAIFEAAKRSSAGSLYDLIAEGRIEGAERNRWDIITSNRDSLDRKFMVMDTVMQGFLLTMVLSGGPDPERASPAQMAMFHTLVAKITALKPKSVKDVIRSVANSATMGTFQALFDDPEVIKVLDVFAQWVPLLETLALDGHEASFWMAFAKYAHYHASEALELAHTIALRPDVSEGIEDAALEVWVQLLCYANNMDFTTVTSRRFAANQRAAVLAEKQGRALERELREDNAVEQLVKPVRATDVTTPIIFDRYAVAHSDTSDDSVDEDGLVEFTDTWHRPRA